MNIKQAEKIVADAWDAAMMRRTYELGVLKKKVPTRAQYIKKAATELINKIAKEFPAPSQKQHNATQGPYEGTGSPNE